MNIDFSFSGQVDIVASYAAILSTLIALWEFIKWLKKHDVLVKCSPNMVFMPSADKKKYVNIVVTNKGATQTTITHCLMYYWKNRFDKIFNRNRQSFIINEQSLPRVIQPGEQWMGQAIQDEKVEKMAQAGILYMGIMHSMKKKEILNRIKIIKEEKTNA